MSQPNIDNPPVITLDHITIRIRDKFILADTSWVIKKNQHWAIIGPNGAGKSSLVRAIVGELPVVRGKITSQAGKSFRRRIRYVSFELHQRLIANEEARDEARYFSGRLNEVSTARDLICSSLPDINDGHQQFDPIVEKLNIAHLLDRGIRFLSTGEMRKIMIARALLQSPKLLILDEPFDGLDTGAQYQLAEMINALMDADRQIILVTHRLSEIPSNITHVMGLKAGAVIFRGHKARMLTQAKIKELYHGHHFRNESIPMHHPGIVSVPLRLPHVLVGMKNTTTEPLKLPHVLVGMKNTTAEPLKLPHVLVGMKNTTAEPLKLPHVLVEMKNTTVRYKDVTVLKDLSWTMQSGENWALSGPNGAGKTTLLSLISGDNPQAYANEIYLFGKRRGTGESIWDIKQQIGLISSEFQIRYRKQLSALEVILSGFFDSVGLYRRSSQAQREIAAKWLAFIHLADRAAEPFNHFSYGQQRLILLARAMVKLPPLLILDEPCQGLDRANRKMVLNLIDAIAAAKKTHILFVTHYRDEFPACITHHLCFEPAPHGKYTPRVYAMQS
jgi:molybdate transport system ATP-binding protein